MKAIGIERSESVFRQLEEIEIREIGEGVWPNLLHVVEAQVEARQKRKFVKRNRLDGEDLGWGKEMVFMNE